MVQQSLPLPYFPDVNLYVPRVASAQRPVHKLEGFIMSTETVRQLSRPQIVLPVKTIIMTVK